jgi:DNA (cytosine-5)-methyltransferase 1
VVDLFCGAGGTSTGILQACRALGLRVNLTAVNHWDTAVNTHSLNLLSNRAKGIHVRHICEPVENLWPARVIPSRRLHLLCASCECTFHSLARGGGPCNEQSRSQPWQIIRWCSDIRVDNLVMENVREWVHWGPLHPCNCGAKDMRKHRKGSKCLRPIESRRGEYFRAFLQALKDMGYKVDWRIQNAADFGDPTSRKRLILLASLDNEIVWPRESHGPARRQPWRTARQIIDWNLKGQSIFNRKKSLSKNTLRRIATGLQKFGGPHAQPFLVMMYGTNKARSLDRPTPTVTTSNKIALASPRPFIVPQQRFKNKSADSVDQPLRTVTTANARLFNLIQPKVKKVKPFLVNMKGRSTAASVDKPAPTVTAHAPHLYLAEPFILPNEGYFRGNTARSTNEPLNTITAGHGGGALVNPVLIQTDQTGGNGDYSQPVDKPLKTIVTKQNTALVQPYIVKYYGTGIAKSVDTPLDTVTTKDRFLLVEPKTGRAVAELDILFRMLQPHELSAAMSFPKGYRFTGTKEDAVKQIGNAVPVKLARAHALAQLGNLFAKS